MSRPKATPGQKIKWIRDAHNLSQFELACAIGTTVQFVSNIERDVSPIPFRAVKLLARCLKTSISEVALYALESSAAHKEFSRLLNEDRGV